MDFMLTDHAKKRCIKRGIQVEWIGKALDHPARIENDDGSGLPADDLAPNFVTGLSSARRLDPLVVHDWCVRASRRVVTVSRAFTRAQTLRLTRESATTRVAVNCRFDEEAIGHRRIVVLPRVN